MHIAGQWPATHRLGLSVHKHIINPPSQGEAEADDHRTAHSLMHIVLGLQR